MSKATLRNNDGNPFLYLEGATGSSAFGVDASNNDQVNLVTSDAVQNVDPTSANPSIAIQSTNPGDIKFSPKGIGQSTFLNGDVEIYGNNGTGDGNLKMHNTTAGGQAGVVELGGNRFIHKFGTDNTFVGDLAGTFSLTTGSAFGNTAIGSAAMNDLTIGAYNTAVGVHAGTAITQGNENSAFGQDALAALTTGSYNIGIGANAAASLVTGSYNTFLGFQVGTNYTTSESSNITIGNNIPGTAAESHVIRIGAQGAGNGQQQHCYVAGIYNSSNTSAGVVGVDTNGKLAGSNGTNGQVQIGGGTGPVWANITSTDGSITVTNGANAINVATTAQPGITWSQVTGTTQAAAANAGYIANNAGLVTITLLAAASAGIGTKLRVTGMNNATGWKIAQNASQQIFFGTTSTTAGVTGSLASTATRDSVELVCISADGLFWNVLSSVGNITVA